MDSTLLALLRCPLTGSPLALDTAVGSDDDIRYGVLQGDAVAYPVVEGIPVMLEGHEPVVDLVRAGRHHDAVVHMLYEDIPPGGRRRILEALASVSRTRALVSPFLRRDDVRRSRAAAAALRDQTPDSLLRFAYLESTGRMVDAYDYFTLRCGTPRHLVALSCIEAVPEGEDPVLDLGCGTGILTWSLADRVAPRLTVGVDRSFVMVLTARRSVVPGGAFVCGDATALPFADDVFGAAVVTDVMTVVDRRRTVVAELDRVLGPRGWCALTTLHNVKSEHTYTRYPTTAAAWHRLVDPMPHRLFSDDAILERYLAGKELLDGPEFDDAGGEQPSHFTIVAARSESDLRERGSWRDWPHARGSLHVNPLYEPRARSATGVEYERRLPSAIFSRDNAPVADYLPEHAFVSDEVWTSIAAESPSAETRALVESFVLLGGPRLKE